MSESRRSKLSAVKVIGIVLGGLVMLGVALVTFAILRPSLPFLLGEDIESFAVIGRNDAKVCGTPVSTLGAPNHQAGSSDLGSPRVQVLSWRLIYPLEGAASVRITGTGFQKAPDYEASTGNCEEIGRAHV